MPLNSLENNRTTHKYLHSFCIHPKNTFENQHNDEKVLLLLRAHPITFVPWIFTAFILFFLPFGLNFIYPRFLSVAESIFINILWYGGLFSYIFVKIVAWLFNVGIVTNQRVVDIDYHSIIHKEVTGTSLEDITDVTSRTSGFIRSYFHYGDAFVQTAGREQNIDFLKIPEPAEVVSIINRIMR